MVETGLEHQVIVFRSSGDLPPLKGEHGRTLAPRKKNRGQIGHLMARPTVEPMPRPTSKQS